MGYYYSNLLESEAFLNQTFLCLMLFSFHFNFATLKGMESESKEEFILNIVESEMESN